MEEHQNTESNDSNQDSAQQSNNGFEVLSNDNSNSADRKDDLRKSNDSLPSQEANSKKAYSEVATEEEQQSPSKNEQPSDTSPNTESVVQVNTENISPVTNTEEVNLLGKDEEEEDAESGSPKKFDEPNQNDNQETVENQSEETQPLASSPEPHQEHQQEHPVHHQEAAKTTADSPNKKPARESSSSPLKERKPVYAPTFAVNPDGQEPKPQTNEQPHHQHEQPHLTVAVNPHQPHIQPQQGYQQPVFLPILDVCTEYQRGNFLPVIHCLKYNLIPREYLDGSGYNVLHHAVSYNNGDVVLMLLDHFKMDVNLRSGSNQTCVMIASNFGFIELIKMTLDHGGRINDQDNTRFTAALYCIKQGNVVSLLYLMARGADLSIPDSNGCTVVHWSAYKNNVFLLRMFRRLGFDMNGVDLAGLTPLQRAIAAEAVHAVDYLLEDLGVPVPPGIQIDTVLNQKIREIVSKHMPRPKGFVEKTKHDALTAFQSAPQLFTFGFYTVFLILGLCFYYISVIQPSRGSYVFHLIFFVFVLYFLAYAYWYYLKSTESIPKLKKFAYEKVGGSNDSTNESTIIDSSFEQTARSPYRQDYLDTLISRGNHKLYEAKENPSYPYPSFLHEVFSDVEKGDFAKVALFDERLYCPSTLLPKKQKSKFCKQTHSVVEGFSHYSHTLSAPIDQNNHFFYFALLIQQTLLLSLFVFSSIYTYNDEREDSWMILMIEIIYLVGKRAGVLSALYLAACTIMFGYSLFFMCVEMYCVARNLTYNELFNCHRYPYLYRINQHAAPGMQMVKVFYNPNDKGTIKNIKAYFLRLVQ